MATLRAAVRAVLEADGTLTGILTGGIHDAEELDRRGFSVSDFSTDASGNLKPTAVMRWGASAQIANTHYQAETRSLEIYLYDQKTFNTIESAAQRIQALLHRKNLGASSDMRGCRIDFVSGSAEYRAQELSNAAARMIRFSVRYNRS